MIKKLRDKAKSKKGFTLVELIVVIVIILILAAVMVPQLLRYVDQAREANATAEAATLMSELQAEFALAKTGDTEPDDLTVGNNVTFERVETLTTGDAQYTVARDANTGEETISGFRYNNNQYTAVWTQADQWTVTRNDADVTP